MSEIGTEEPGPTDDTAAGGGGSGVGGSGVGGSGGADPGPGSAREESPGSAREEGPRSARDDGLGSAREEAERLVAAGLGAVSTALQDMEARRQLRGLAEQLLGSEQAQDLAAGLNGFVSGVTGGVAPGPRQAPGPRGADSHNHTTSDHATSDRATSDRATSDHATSDHAAGDGAGAAAGGYAPLSHGPRFSTGSADCCICPVCRVIAALRDPSPELAERLATAVGDVAVGLVGVMRAFSAPTSAPTPASASGERPGEAADPWRAATVPPPRPRPEPTDSEILEDSTSPTMSNLPRSREEPAAAAKRPAMAKKAVKKANKRA
jgi:hypothetical protein